jgi:putative ABC transport system permease protein
MIRNYLTTALRNLTKHKSFSLINMIGLSFGLTACLLIAAFVYDENQFDRFIPEGGQVYRIYSEYTNSTGTQKMAVTPPVFATLLRKDFPEVETTSRVLMTAAHKTLFEVEGKKLYEESGIIADSNFFEVLPLPGVFGSPHQWLADPSSIAISDEMSARFFGNANPVGKQLIMDKTPMLVKGVFTKNPKFHLSFDYIIPLSAAQIPAERMQSWGWHQFVNYVKLKKGSNVEKLQTKFQQEVKIQSDVKNNHEAQSADKPFFQPLGKIHLYSADLKFDMATRGNIVYVYALTIIAGIILLIACFNFVNLSTAKSLQRAKEVGVRKTIGADRKQLILQFMGETMLLMTLSMIISVLLAGLLIPWLNEFTNKQIKLGLLFNPPAIAFIILIILLAGTLAGFYPAIVLSGFKPVQVLKGNATSLAEPGKNAWLRKSLVIGQFALSVLLTISAIIVLRQVNYLHNKDLGFNKEQIMFFPMRGDKMFHNSETFKQELLRSPGISSVSIGYGYPGDAVAGDEIITNINGKPETHSATQLAADYDYVKTLGLEIIQGRDFSRSMSTDRDHSWIINETAVRLLGFGTPAKAIGQKLSWHPWDGNNKDSLKTGLVVGVVKDFNYKSLYDQVEPAVIQIYPEAAWKVAVKFSGSNIGRSIDQVKSVWNRFAPEYPIEYKFLDENFEQMYRSEDKLKSLLLIFTGIAIFVACLGLLGLAAYHASRRRKEVGIRKVLGASTENLIYLLSKDFIKLVLISLIISSPIAWYFMNKWLQDFAYRINIGWTVFLLAGLLAIGVALATVSLQALKAAWDNPVKSLRTE